MTIPRHVTKLSIIDWRYIIIATKELLLARIRHAMQSTETIIREFNTDLPCQLRAPPDAADLDRRSWAIAAAAARVPWRSDCLLQAMAANRWLRRDRMQPELFLGVIKDGSGNLQAHAWLKYGGISVTGGNGEGFATFQ